MCILTSLKELLSQLIFPAFLVLCSKGILGFSYGRVYLLGYFAAKDAQGTSTE